MELHSLSSSLMFGTTLYRNQAGIVNKGVAQAGYALIAVVAVVETVVAAFFTTLCLVASPFNLAPFDRAGVWLLSSTFSIVWAGVDFVLNPFVVRLIADEGSAMLVRLRNLMLIPRGAFLHPGRLSHS
jgi:hypothetical protein